LSIPRCLNAFHPGVEVKSQRSSKGGPVRSRSSHPYLVVRPKPGPVPAGEGLPHENKILFGLRLCGLRFRPRRLPFFWQVFFDPSLHEGSHSVRFRYRGFCGYTRCFFPKQTSQRPKRFESPEFNRRWASALITTVRLSAPGDFRTGNRWPEKERPETGVPRRSLPSLGGWPEIQIRCWMIYSSALHDPPKRHFEAIEETPKIRDFARSFLRSLLKNLS
jgi:hypothetical protein